MAFMQHDDGITVNGYLPGKFPFRHDARGDPGARP
jgi:hypothetical protein